jgi:glycosyltransferase involved in cell wall biosynthesis
MSSISKPPAELAAKAPARRAGPVRTLFLSSCVWGGGAGWSLYYLLKHLDRTRIEPFVWVPDRGIFGERFSELGLRVETPRRLHIRGDQQRFAARGALARAGSIALNALDATLLVPELAHWLRRERVGLVYCNNMMVKPIGTLAAQMAGAPCVLHVRNLHETPGKVLFYGSLARLPAVRRIIANSAASAVPYRRHAPGKVEVVHNGIDLAEYTPESVPRGQLRRELGAGTEVCLVGFTGNLIPRKGLEPLIRAAARLLPARSGLLFVAIGRVPPDNPVDHRAGLERLTHELGIADRFRFLGFRADVRPAVADLDVLVLPSLQEPFGRSIIEAMALGVPVVASRVGGIPEILTDGRDGLLVPPGDVEALAAAIGGLVDEPARRAALAGAAQQRVRRELDVARLSERIEALLLEAAGR